MKTIRTQLDKLDDAKKIFVPLYSNSLPPPLPHPSDMDRHPKNSLRVAIH